MRRIGTIVTVAALVLTATACGSSSESSSTTSTSPTETVTPLEEWTNGVCTTIGDYATAVETRAGDFTPDTSDLAALKQSWTDFLDGMLDDTQALIDDLKALGRPDVAEGTEAGQAVVASFEDVQASIQAIRDAADGLDENDPKAFLADFQSALTDFQTAIQSIGGPAQDLGPEIQAAFENEPACASLSS
jgi:hypothetical protein